MNIQKKIKPKKKNKYKKEKNLLFNNFPFNIRSIIPRTKKKRRAPGENKTLCNITVVTNNGSSCCLVKSKNATKNYCHEIPWNKTANEEHQKEVEKTYSGEKVEVICNAKFLSIGFIFALLVFVL